MATSLIPLLLLSSGFGEPPKSTFGFGNQYNYGGGLQRTNPYLFPPRDFYTPSIFGRDPFEDLYSWPFRGFNELALPNYIDQDGLNIVLNVEQYRPDEIEVRVVSRLVVVRGKHEEEVERPTKQEDAEELPSKEVERKPSTDKLLRQFERRFAVPANVDLDKITSTVSSDHILTIRAPFKDVPKEDEGKKITIQETGKPAVIKPAGGSRPAVNQEPVKKDEDTNEIKVENKPEPESREENINTNKQESAEVKKEDKNDEMNDIDGVSITTVPDDSTTPLK